MLHTNQIIYPVNDLYRDVRAAKDVKSLFATCNVQSIEYEDNLTLEDILLRLLTSVSSSKLKDNEAVQRCLSEKIRSGALQSIRECTNGISSTWIIYFMSVDQLKSRLLMLGTFDRPINFSHHLERVCICCLILCPESFSFNYKSPVSTARCIATFLSDSTFRLSLREIRSQSDLSLLVDERLTYQQRIFRTNEIWSETLEHTEVPVKWINFMSGVKENIYRRSQLYISDWTDGITDTKTISKVISTAIFLYFLCLLPTLAFGVLNDKNTNNKITAYRAIFGEAIGGIIFSFVAGQPFVIIATTAPIALCNLIVSDLASNFNVEFYTLYALVGIFNSLFLISYGVFGLASFISYSTRSIEEIFSMFIVVAFTVDALHDIFHLTSVYNQQSVDSINITNITSNTLNQLDLTSTDDRITVDSIYLYIFLLIGTLWLAVALYNFKFSICMNSIIRDTLSDYALPISVIVFSFIGITLFRDVTIETYKTDASEINSIKIASFHHCNASIVLISLFVGFAVSLLFYMDQGVSAELVDSPNHHLKKGNANDLDFIVVGVINFFLSLFGFPWMHGLLPHSPLHVQSLADYEEKILPDGTIGRVIVKTRETRLATLIAHILILLTIVFIPQVFSMIPVAVLNGLFLYCAVASLRGNSLYERILLLFTHPSQYSPIYYIRKCPTRKMHSFTLLQLAQLAVLLFIGYAPWPYLRMIFPLFIALLIPMRHLVITRIIGDKFVTALDSYQ